MGQRPFATRKGILAGRACVTRLEDRTHNFVRQSGAVVFHIQSYPRRVVFALALPKRNVNSAHSRHGFRGIFHKVYQDSGKVFTAHADGGSAALYVYCEADSRAGKRGKQVAIGEKFFSQILDRLGLNGLPLARMWPCSSKRDRCGHRSFARRYPGLCVHPWSRPTSVCR